MTSKALIYNVKQYNKKRDVSMDGNNLKATAKAVNNVVRLPALAGQAKAVKGEQLTAKRIAHSRVQSISSRYATKTQDPKERAKEVLVEEFGKDVDFYLKKLESECKISESHLAGH